MEDQTQLPGAGLQAVLLALCNSHGWTSSFLSTPVSSSAELTQLCMKELAACRAAGRNDVALALADAAMAGGVDHPRLASHRERARQQQRGGALVRANHRSSSALAVADSHHKLGQSFWQWLAGLGGKRKSKRQTQAMAGTQEQLEALTAVCHDAGWSPSALSSEVASRDLSLALLSEMRACAEADKHRLVVRLAKRAAGLGIQNSQINELQRQSQALLHRALSTKRAVAIQLRKQGQPAASLALLDAALASGDQDPWVQHNRARALVDLGRRSDAIRIWEQLQAHQDPAVAAAAGKMLQNQSQKLLLPLHKSLQQLAAGHAWQLRHLGDPASLDLQAYTTSVLQEAINARNFQRADLSLAMLEAARSAGLQGPSLDDNRARALVNLSRLPDAMAIWQQLTQVDDADIRQSAQEMVERFGPQAQRLLALTRADQLLQAGNLEQAISTLTEALLKDPDCLEIQGRLQTLVVQRSQGLISQDDPVNQELEAHRRELLAFEEVLNTLEKRLEGDQAQA